MNALTDQITARMQADGVNQARLSKETGVHESIVSPWLKGKYTGDVKKVDATMQAWLDGRLRKQALIEVPDYQPTFTAGQIQTELAFAQGDASLCMIYGDYGVGKSTACRHYAAGNNNVWLVTLKPSQKSTGRMIQAIAYATGMKSKSPTTDEVIERLADTGGLLIFDNAQHLSAQALDELSVIHDEAGIGIALVGNEYSYANLAGNQRTNNYAQLYSRLGTRYHIDEAKSKDIVVLLDAWAAKYPEMNTAKIRKRLTGIASQSGSLRLMTKTLKMALMLAAGDDKPFDDSHITDAWNKLGGD